MFNSIKRWAAGVFAALALGTCAACSGGFIQSEAVQAVQSECLSLDGIDREALCLIGAYEITVDELAEEREAGNIPDAVDPVLDRIINETGPRVEAAALAWGAVLGYREYAEEIQGNVSEEQYLEAVGVFQSAFSDAVADWATLRPQIMRLIILRDEITTE